jgi:PAS domain S-box-containing protein
LNNKLQNQNDELIESKNLYNIIVERATDGVFNLDPEGRVLRSNHKFLSALGYSEKEILEKPIKELINTESPSKILPQIATKRFSERASSNLKVQFCVNEKSSLWKER